MNINDEPDHRLEEVVFLNALEESGLWQLQNGVMLDEHLGPDAIKRCHDFVREHILLGHLVLYEWRSANGLLAVPVNDAIRIINSESAWATPAQIEQGVFLGMTTAGKAYLETINWRRS